MMGEARMKLDFDFILKELNLENMPEDMLLESYPNAYCFISEYVFNLSFYDDTVAELIGKSIYEVITTIQDGKNFDYIEDNENYIKYLLVANVLEINSVINWGTSIRGAWIEHDIRDDITNLFIKIFEFYGKRKLND
jgi:hypothetical protein